MYRVKQLLGGKLSLRNYNGQVGDTYAMIKALNKLIRLGMPEIQTYYLSIILSFYPTQPPLSPGLLSGIVGLSNF